MVDWGIPMVTGLGVLCLFAARAGGASSVYRTFTLIDPPEHVLLWVASLLGWLLVPAIIGGFAGHIIAQRISSVKAISTDSMFRRRPLSRRLRPPGLIDDLGPYFHGSYGRQEFVDSWVRVVHRNDWTLAQDHWEVYVRDLMSTQQYAHLDRHECLRQAQNAGRIVLMFTGRTGDCIVCDRRR
ncbi:DUF6313 family protein [Kitasatospora sp. NPDC050463]|uniref:DUF6313 family protein n=1 Tax=Kitasatospora sp. NPDC050463 TaxID=3155786 RepID=UPI0034107EA1